MDQAEGPEWTEFGPLPEGWYPTEDDRERAGLEHRLGRELAPGHQLEGLKGSGSCEVRAL